MPRDVATRWNSTFDMLDYALAHREAVDQVTQRRDLRKYELGDEEWDLLTELRDILKASPRGQVIHCDWETECRTPHAYQSDTQGCNRVLLTFDPQPGYGHPCHGPY
jgi:hypothetical protein